LKALLLPWERETERVLGEGIVVLRWVQVTRLGLHDRVEEVYMKEGRRGSILTIKRYPTLKILYLLIERRNKEGEIKGESAYAWCIFERRKGRVQDLVVPTARRIGG
jgi:hypothetical protein